MKVINLTILTIFAAARLSAQSNIPINNWLSDRISKQLHENYHPDSVEISKLCRTGCVFVKFRLDNKGRVANIAFSKDSATFINDALAKAINTLNRDVELVKFIQGAGKTIILPVLYDYQIGCVYPKLDGTVATMEDRYKYGMLFLKARSDAQAFESNLLNMLSFGNDNNNPVDCLLLPPFTVGALPDPGY